MDTTMLTQVLQRFDVLLLLFIRMMGLFSTAPIWSNRLVPVQLRVAICFVIALLVLPLTKDAPVPATLPHLAVMVIQELMVGMVIGFIAALVFSAVQLAGEYLDINMGLSIINVLDPMSNTLMPVMGNFLYILSLLLFFSINGHHMLIRAVMDSYVLVPLGTVTLSQALSMQIVDFAASLFVIAFKVAAPVLAALFLTTLSLGILNRAVPQMNVFVVGLPVQLAVGVFMMMVALPLFVTFLQVIFRGMEQDIFTILKLLRG